MTCPQCGGRTDVVTSRPSEDNVKRYRKCTECGCKFTTIEIDEDLYEKARPVDRSAFRAAVDKSLEQLRADLYKVLK